MRIVRTNPGGVRCVVLHLEVQLTEIPGTLSEFNDSWNYELDVPSSRNSKVGSQLAERLKSVPGIGAVQFSTFSIKFELGDVFNELDKTLHVLEELMNVLQVDSLNIIYGGIHSLSSRSNLYEAMKKFYHE